MTNVSNLWFNPGIPVVSFAGAPCVGEPALWFSAVKARRELAREICRTACPHRDQCLIYALACHPSCGIWAGYAPDELKALRRQQKRRENGR
jgi:hypothetical protein